jgi:hypothetical protein
MALGGWVNGWINGWTDGRMDRWMDGRTDGWMDGKERETGNGGRIISLLIPLYDAAIAINNMIASRGIVTPVGTKLYHVVAPQYLVKAEASRVVMLISSVLLQLHVSWGHRRGLKCLYLYSVLSFFFTVTTDRTLVFMIHSLARSYDGVVNEICFSPFACVNFGFTY